MGIGYFKSLHTGYATVAIFCMVNCPAVKQLNLTSGKLSQTP